MRFNRILLCAAVLAPSVLARADDVEGPGKPVTKTYDVRSLCMDVPDYPLTGPMLGSDDREANRRAKDADEPLSAGSLAKLIESTVSPETWRDSGGTVGSINDFQGMLSADKK